MVFFDFRGFWFWKILKIHKTQCFVLDFPVFIEKFKKHHDCFWIFVGFHRKIQKKTIVFFGFSKFLLLEILENPKKPIVVFWIFGCFN